MEQMENSQSDSKGNNHESIVHKKETPASACTECMHNPNLDHFSRSMIVIFVYLLLLTSQTSGRDRVPLYKISATVLGALYA